MTDGRANAVMKKRPFPVVSVRLVTTTLRIGTLFVRLRRAT